MKQRPILPVLLAALLLPAAFAAEKVDLDVMSRIRHEGLENSRVMETLSYLTDIHGPRLTGSPGILSASQWCIDQLQDLGLSDATLEPWGEFGPGWSLRKFSLAMTEPYYSPMIGYPEAWTSGTDGLIAGTPVILDVGSEEELDKYRGKLQGAIVMLAARREAETHFEPDATRRTDQQLSELALAPEPGSRSGWEERREAYRRQRELYRKIDRFLREEAVRAVLKPSRGEHGTVFVGGAPSRDPEKEPALPSVMVSIEHVLRLERLIEKGINPRLEVEIEVEFHTSDLQAYNVIAEIPGTDPNLKDELVMLGAHIDSWHAATGAADNAAGVAVVLEAVRILQAIGAHPRRTVRVALWSGEEQGLLGSRAYVRKHFGDPETPDPGPEHDGLSAYFNYDNGTGRIRGVYLQGNDAVRPIFEEWLKPFHDLGASTLTIRNTGGTDHLSFDAVGLPGFQFIQDPIDYSTRIHHTNMDFWDHALAGDLMQSSVLMAAFVYNAATRDEKLPRKARPAPRSTESEFVSIFDGVTLTGWRRHGGLPGDNPGGKWEVVDGALTGDQDPPGRGGFLITEQKYRDFILRLETQLDYPVDNGIFLRVGDDGKSHQVTLDNRPGGEFGRIYLPWTKDVVYPNPNGIRGFKPGRWNDLEIRIEGEPARIQFRLNGRLVTDFQHTAETTRGVPKEGYVALQVHPGKNWIAGNKVRFRNIRIRELRSNSSQAGP